MSPGNLKDLRKLEHQQRLEASRWRRLLYEQSDPSAAQDLLDQLLQAEEKRAATEKERAAAQADDPQASGLILDNRKKEIATLGIESTGLEVEVRLRLAQVPTSICHLLDPEQNRLLSCQVKYAAKLPGKESDIRRVRVISYIEGYSAQVVDMAEIKFGTSHTFMQLPTLFRNRVQSLDEITRATLNVMVQDMDDHLIELHRTYPVWLLAWTTAPFAIEDPKTGEYQDLSQYYGAFVTPNAPAVMEFLSRAKQYHPEKEFGGYQDCASVELQVKALFDALKAETKITYVNSVIAFSPDHGWANQRVRLPRESLEHGMANCVDGTVLFASLLEAISMSPAIVVVPEHTFVAWETGESSDEWCYLDTTRIGSYTFEQACKWGQIQAKGFQTLAQNNKNESLFRRWPLRELRAVHRIFPME